MCATIWHVCQFVCECTRGEEGVILHSAIIEYAFKCISKNASNGIYYDK